MLDRLNTAGQRIKACRFYNKEYSAKDFCAKHGIHASMLSMVENDRRPPTNDLIDALANVFDVPAEFLLNGKNPPEWWNNADMVRVLRRFDTANVSPASVIPPNPPTSNPILDAEFSSLRPGYVEAPPQCRDIVRYILSNDLSEVTHDEWVSLSNTIINLLSK